MARDALRCPGELATLTMWAGRGAAILALPGELGSATRRARSRPNGSGELMEALDVAVVLAHGAWADGSSWSKVIAALRLQGVRAMAAPLPLTCLADDVAALDQMLERVEGPVVVAGNAYAGAVISSTSDEKVASLVYVAALAPDEGETVGDIFYRPEPHPQAQIGRAHV